MIIPTTFILSGDEERAKALIGAGKSMLSALRHDLSYRSLPTASPPPVEVGGGATIRCVVNYGLTEVHIHVPVKPNEDVKKTRTLSTFRVYLYTIHAPIRGDDGAVTPPGWNGIANTSVYLANNSLSPLHVITCCIYDTETESAIEIKSGLLTTAPSIPWPRSQTTDGPWDRCCSFAELSTVVAAAPAMSVSTEVALLVTEDTGNGLILYGTPYYDKVFPTARYENYGNTNFWQFSVYHSGLLGRQAYSLTDGVATYNIAVWRNDTYSYPETYTTDTAIITPGLWWATRWDSPYNTEVYDALWPEIKELFMGCWLECAAYDYNPQICHNEGVETRYRRGESEITDTPKGQKLVAKVVSDSQTSSGKGCWFDLRESRMPLLTLTRAGQPSREAAVLMTVGIEGGASEASRICYEGPMGRLFSGVVRSLHVDETSTSIDPLTWNCDLDGWWERYHLFSSYHGTGPIMACHYPTYIVRTPNWYETTSGAVVAVDAFFGEAHHGEFGEKWTARFLWNFKGFVGVPSGSGVIPSDVLAGVVRDMFASAYSAVQMHIDGHLNGPSMMFENTLIPSVFSKGVRGYDNAYDISLSPGAVYGEPIISARLYFVPTTETLA